MKELFLLDFEVKNTGADTVYVYGAEGRIEVTPDTLTRVRVISSSILSNSKKVDPYCFNQAFDAVSYAYSELVNVYGLNVIRLCQITCDFTDISFYLPQFSESQIAEYLLHDPEVPEDLSSCYNVYEREWNTADMRIYLENNLDADFSIEDAEQIAEYGDRIFTLTYSNWVRCSNLLGNLANSVTK